MHLTNYAVNKNSTHFQKNLDDNSEASKWSLSTLKKYFAENN